MSQPPPDYGDCSLLELFRVEAENQVAVFNAALLEVERDPTAGKQLEALMRAAHSLKGAAQIVKLPIVARLAHALEDYFVAAQRGKVLIGRKEIDVLLCAVDFFAQISKTPEAAITTWETDQAVAVEEFLSTLAALLAAKTDASRPLPEKPAPVAIKTIDATTLTTGRENPGGMLRLTTETVNRLLGLAGESLVESRRFQPFTASMQRLKRLHSELSTTLDNLRETLAVQPLSERASAQASELSARVAACREFLTGRIDELEIFDRRAARLSSRLYQETLQVRMRPFGDGVNRFPRMVRDLARSLGKEVRLEITGENTQVDRDILEKLDAPLTHLLRNALDHGCESTAERQRQNKPTEGVLRLEARHSAGMLLVTVSDDGRGIDSKVLRATLVRKNLMAAEVAEKLTEPELMEFLFLPGFSTRENVSEISGRGVGLDVVREMVKSVRGKIHVAAQPGKGTRIQLQLPISLAVLRALLVEVAGEPYAVPLAQIVQALKLPKARVQSLTGRRHFTYNNEQVALIMAHQVLERLESNPPEDELPVVIIGGRNLRYGLVVDSFLGERELVVQPLDPRLGKVRDISAAAMMEDGSPVLIMDVEDMVRSIDKIVTGGLLRETGSNTSRFINKQPRWILVVDDSITVRELHNKLLTEQGYLVEMAVDGMDGWNVVRSGKFDLVITDVDMPRMDGLELVSLIRQDLRLRLLPVLIVSHKDREEDRWRGLEAGADEYLTKSGFQDEKLLQVVRKLITKSER